MSTQRGAFPTRHGSGGSFDWRPVVAFAIGAGLVLSGVPVVPITALAAAVVMLFNVSRRAVRTSKHPRLSRAATVKISRRTPVRSAYVQMFTPPSEAEIFTGK
jgi:hypothetical protein